MGVENIESLHSQVVALRDNWQAMWNEAKTVSSSLQIEVKLCSTATRKRFKIHNKADEQTSDENLGEAC